MLFKKGITTTKTDRRVKVFIRDCGRQPVALREYSLCGECKSSPLKSWKKRTLNSLIVHTQQMINLFLRQHKSLILLLLLASIRPLMVWAQSVQKHVGYVPAVEPSTTLTWKYLKRNEVPLGYHKNLPLLQPLFRWDAYLVAAGPQLRSRGGSMWLLCSMVSLHCPSLAWYVGVMNHTSSSTSQLPSLSWAAR